MPTYDYECPKGHRFEVFQRMSDEPVSSCPTCGAPAMRKISGGAGFLFKGEGFYITDHRSDEYKKKASSDVGDAKPVAPASNAEGKSGASAEKGAGKSEAPTGGGKRPTPGSDS
jgi:putative FmdB family regulatory protein